VPVIPGTVPVPVPVFGTVPVPVVPEPETPALGNAAEPVPGWDGVGLAGNATLSPPNNWLNGELGFNGWTVFGETVRGEAAAPDGAVVGIPGRIVLAPP